MKMISIEEEKGIINDIHQCKEEQRTRRFPNESNKERNYFL
jgi:hypothetical protein